MNNFIKIILIGNINAGKSSLINAIFKQYLAEVSPVGGKTQEATSYNYDISFNGMNVKIVDTPGMSEASSINHSSGSPVSGLRLLDFLWTAEVQ